MISASLLCGLGQAFLWTGSGLFVSQCAVPVPEHKGLYYAIYWSTYMLSQVFGNLAAAFIIGLMDQVSFFYIMSTVALLSTLAFVFMRKPKAKLMNSVVETSSESILLQGGAIQRISTISELDK